MSWGTSLVCVADEAVVGHIEDRRIGVAVDGHDRARVFHACQMLHGAGNSHRDVQFWRHDFAGLADLQLVRRNSRVDECARAADGAAKRIGEFADEALEIFRVFECSTAGDDDPSLGDIRRALFFDFNSMYRQRETSFAVSISKRSTGCDEESSHLAAGYAEPRTVTTCGEPMSRKCGRDGAGILGAIELQAFVGEFVAENIAGHRSAEQCSSAWQNIFRECGRGGADQIELALRGDRGDCPARKNRPAVGRATDNRW